MKKIFLLSLLIFILHSLAAGEVYFIPGWYSKWKNFDKTAAKLEKIFPGNNVNVCKWDSDRLWHNALAATDPFAIDLAGKIAQNPTEEVILIGHSLGGRIVLKCVAQLAAKNKQVKQVILLGTAYAITAEDIENCRKVSRLPVINIFCVDDNMLKLFLFKEKNYPLGLAGIPEKTGHFCQYRMFIKNEDLRIFNVTIIPGKFTEPFRESIEHLSAYYIRKLEEVISGNAAECYYDLPGMESIAAGNSVVADAIPGFTTIDSCDSWRLEYRSVRKRYRIISPSGRKFCYTSEAHAAENFSRIKKMIPAKLP